MLSSLRVAAVFYLLVLFGGCAGSQQSSSGFPAPILARPAAQPPLTLPAPAGLTDLLETPRSTSYTEEDLICHGGGFANSLPHSRVNQAGYAAEFHPEFEAALGLSSAAYCIYSLGAPDYDRDPVVYFNWDVAPPDPDQAYIALGNWDAGSWDWFQFTGGETFSPGSFENYLGESGQLLLAIVSLGFNADFSLNWLRLDEEMPPVNANLLTYIPKGIAPLDLLLDAGLSAPGVGSFELVEWDWDGDGTFDGASGTALSTSHLYETAGEYTPAVRLTTEYGVQATASSQPVEVLSPFVHSWGGSASDIARAVATYGDAIYIAGQTQSYGEGGWDALLVKYTTDGAFQWARSWGSEYSEYYVGLDVSPTGLVYAVGSTGIYNTVGTDILIQCWNGDGELQWTDVWGDDLSYDEGKRLAYHDGNLYILGTGDLRASGNYDGTLLKLNDLGEFQWVRAFGGDYGENATGLEVVQPPAQPLEIHVAGMYGIGDPDTEPMYCRFTDDGTDGPALIVAARWTGAAEYIGPTDVHVISFPAQRVFLTGSYDLIERNICLLEFIDPGSPVAQYWTANQPLLWFRNSLLESDGSLLLAGSHQPEGASQSGFIMHIAADGSLLGAKLLAGEEESAMFLGLAYFHNEGLVAVGRTSAAPSLAWQAAEFSGGAIGGGWAGAAVACVEEYGMLRHGISGQVAELTDGVEDADPGDVELLVTATAVP